MQSGIMTLPLTEVPIGHISIIQEVRTRNQARRRMLDLGLITNTAVEPLYKSPAGDPTAYQFRGTVIALRADEAANIIVKIKNAT